LESSVSTFIKAFVLHCNSLTFMLSEGVDCHDEILFSKQIAKLIDLDVKIN